MNRDTLDKKKGPKLNQLRFITCGSVDDGKSTLLGRLLYDSKSVLEDQLQVTGAESKKYGTQGEEIDLALLVDGLQAEREQGITIDVAYRYFETERRKFIAADTPGHTQYTRNMATGASTADLAIVLIDARKGIIEQTKRHSKIVSMLGVKHIVLTVNKMDLVDYSQETFDQIIADYKAFAGQFGIENLTAIPVSALAGDNIFTPSTNMSWYKDTTLIDHLETVVISKPVSAFRLPVQLVNRSTSDFRGFSGTIVGSQVKVGDEIISVRSQKTSTIKRIIGASGDLVVGIAGDAVTVELADEIDISRGDVISHLHNQPEVVDKFAAHLIWMSEDEMLPERTYMARFPTQKTDVQITDLVHVIDVNTLHQHAAKTLSLNGVGYCKFATSKEVVFDPYEHSPETGSFILIDKYSNATVGAGMIDHPLSRGTNIKWHEMKVDKEARAVANKQKPCVLWFTGFSGSGKSTVADVLEQKLFAMGHRTYLLDGDNVRHGLNKDLGFTDQDRVENIRRVAEVAKLMSDAGLIVITSFISPFVSERQMARELMDEGEYTEVFVNTPLEVCEARDPKGLYKKARSGELKNFTGIDSTYEVPTNAEIVLAGGTSTPEEMADEIIAKMKADATI